VDAPETQPQYENTQPEQIARDFAADDVDEEYATKTRDNKKSYRGRLSNTSNTGGKKKGSVVDVFTHRMARIMGVAESAVPELFTSQQLKTARTNELRYTDSDIDPAEDLANTLASYEIDASQLSWFNSAYTFQADQTPTVQGLDIIQDGKAFIQNPSSFLPVFALEARPGMRVVDMCSSPGGKASLIASLTRGEVDLSVNEPKARRAQRLRDVLDLLGVEANLTMHDGKHLPALLGHETFDRVIVDAECSTEAGINFLSREPLKDWSLERVQRVSVLQRQLITAGYDLLKPGGVLVYSTCTLSPEENEGVVQALLDRRTDAVVQPLQFDAEATMRSIKKWEGKKFIPEVSNGVLRVMPSSYMEGFFLARIRKPLPSEDESVYNEPVSLDTIAKAASK
jgi:16S rRNA (cytosine1407-C5)-methyltransferase